MPAIPVLQEPLTDGRVTLRFAAERDIPEILIAHQDDPQLYVRLGDERPPSGAELGRWMEEAPNAIADGRGVSLTMLTDGSDQCLGQVNVHHIDWDHGRAELGVWVVPQARQRGLAAGSLRLVSGWVFRQWGLERVQLLTEPENEPMLAAGRAAGFVYEGVLRGYARERGQRVDVAILSLLPGDAS